MTSPVREQLASAEQLMERIACSLVMEIPADLARLVAVLKMAQTDLRNLPSGERGLAVAQLKSFREKLAIFSLAMKRSEAILQQYSRDAGASLHVYGPDPGFGSSRDPAFFDLAV
jgi:hypothetical protein